MSGRLDRTPLIEITSRNNECAQYVARVPFAQAGARVDQADLAGPAFPCSQPRTAVLLLFLRASAGTHRTSISAIASASGRASCCSCMRRVTSCSCSLSEISLPSRNPVATFPSESNPRGGWDKGAASALVLYPFLRMRSNILAFVRSSTTTTAIVHAPVIKGIEPNEGHYMAT